jgi:hypothetical protein
MDAIFTIKANILNHPGKFGVFFYLYAYSEEGVNVHKIVAFPSFVHRRTQVQVLPNIVEAYISENVNCSNFCCPLSICLISIYMFCDAVVTSMLDRMFYR